MRNQQRREETRAAILQAAAQCFSERGYQATGVAEICHRAGVSKGAFYYHFESKQALFLALIEAWHADLDASLSALPHTEGPVPDRLLAMAHMFQHILESQSQSLALIMEFWMQASRDDAVRQAVLAPYRNFQQFFVGLIQQGITEGSLRPIDPVAGAQVILSLASGLFFEGLLDPHGADWGQVTENSIQILIDGLRRERYDSGNRSHGTRGQRIGEAASRQGRASSGDGAAQ